jgi:hypothetical protein
MRFLIRLAALLIFFLLTEVPRLMADDGGGDGE